MKREPLDLSHRELLAGHLRAVDTALSEYSFANLYLFRDNHRYEVLSDGDDVFVAGLTYDGARFIMPARNVDPACVERLAALLAEFDIIFPVPEPWLPLFPAPRFAHAYSDGDTDYVYTIEKMSTYPGKKLHKKRNLMKQYEELYEHEEFPLTDDRIADARAVLEEWQTDMGVPPRETDYRSCVEALERYEELALCGGIYYAAGQPAGFILGEELDAKTFALHFAKGLRRFKGVYQFMYNSFARIMPAQYCCLNFEQDLGREALRQAKTSYVPDQLLRKYRVRLR